MGFLRRFWKKKQDPQKAIFKQWFADRGDETLRLDYALDQDSLTFDMGGYHGDWAEQIHAKYGCRVEVFEPIDEFADLIAKRFQGTPEVSLHRFGLAGHDGEVEITMDGDFSSIHRKSDNMAAVRLKQADTFLEENGVEMIDLMKVNIEGGEFDLLEHLLDTGWASKIRNIQVQFHRDIPQAETRMEAIQKRLAETHRLSWQYRFVWENWELK